MLVAVGIANVQINRQLRALLISKKFVGLAASAYVNYCVDYTHYAHCTSIIIL